MSFAWHYLASGEYPTASCVTVSMVLQADRAPTKSQEQSKMLKRFPHLNYDDIVIQ